MNSFESGSDNQDSRPAKGSTPPSRGQLWLGITCVVAILLVWALKPLNISIPPDVFLPLHMLLEMSSIVVSFAVFTTGWYGFKQHGSVRDLLIGVIFFTAGALDLVHTLSYQGMPDFLGMSSPGKAAGYWMVSRFVVGIGLLSVVLLRPEQKSRWLSPWSLVGGAVAIVAASITVFTMSLGAAGKLFFDSEAGGLTTLKVVLEYLVILVYVAVILLLSPERGWSERVATLLRTALLLAIFAELAFTAYQGPYEPFNALGHLLKTAAYYMILNALFVSAVQRPYVELSRTKEEVLALYQDARDHRSEMEQSFARIGSALSSSLRLDEALDQIAELAVEMLHADCSIVISMDKYLRPAQVAAQKGGCHDVYRPIDLTQNIGRQAISERKTILVNDIESSGLVECDFQHEDCLRSMLCAPMIHSDDPMGVIAIFAHTAGAFEQGDANLLEGFASHAAVAIHNAISYERESRIADALQRSFLSSTKVRTDQFEIAQVYEPAMDEALVGGDFYDVMVLPDGKVGLAIGDVSGKGLQAAVHTAMVKYTLRAYVNEGHSPAKAVHLLDKVLSEHTGSETFVTMFYGVLDTGTGEMIYTNAGHEPPVYSCDGTFLTLPSTGPALGLGIHIGFTEGRIMLERGSVLLLYTDGISEARHGMSFLGTERIGEELLLCEELNSEDLAKCVHKAAISFAGGELKDDAAILAVRALG